MHLQSLFNHNYLILLLILLFGIASFTHAQQPLSLVYQAADSNHLHAAWLSDYNWTGGKKIDVAGQTLHSNIAPSSAMLKQNLHIVYSQGGYVKDLYTAWFDGESWRGNKKIWADGKVLQSNTTPSLVAFDNKLYLIFQHGLTAFFYTAQFDGQTWTDVKPIIIGQNYLTSSTTPTPVVFKKKLYLIYSNQETNALHMAHLVGKKWQDDKTIQIPMGNTIKSYFSPGAATFKDTLYVVYKKSGSYHLYTAQYDGKKWQHNDLIPPINGEFLQSGYNPQLTVFDQKLYLIYRNAHNNTVYNAWFDGKHWGGNTAINQQPYWVNVESNFNPSVSVYGNPTTAYAHPTTTAAQYLDIKLLSKADYF